MLYSLTVFHFPSAKSRVEGDKRLTIFLSEVFVAGITEMPANATDLPHISGCNELISFRADHLYQSRCLVGRKYNPSVWTSVTDERIKTFLYSVLMKYSIFCAVPVTFTTFLQGFSFHTEKTRSSRSLLKNIPA